MPAHGGGDSRAWLRGEQSQPEAFRRGNLARGQKAASSLGFHPPERVGEQQREAREAQDAEAARGSAASGRARRGWVEQPEAQDAREAEAARGSAASGRARRGWVEQPEAEAARAGAGPGRSRRGWAEAEAAAAPGAAHGRARRGWADAEAAATSAGAAHGSARRGWADPEEESRRRRAASPSRGNEERAKSPARGLSSQGRQKRLVPEVRRRIATYTEAAAEHAGVQAAGLSQGNSSGATGSESRSSGSTAALLKGQSKMRRVHTPGQQQQQQQWGEAAAAAEVQSARASAGGSGGTVSSARSQRQVLTARERLEWAEASHVGQADEARNESSDLLSRHRSLRSSDSRGEGSSLAERPSKSKQRSASRRPPRQGLAWVAGGGRASGSPPAPGPEAGEALETRLSGQRRRVRVATPAPSAMAGTRAAAGAQEEAEALAAAEAGAAAARASSARAGRGRGRSGAAGRGHEDVEAMGEAEQIRLLQSALLQQASKMRDPESLLKATMRTLNAIEVSRIPLEAGGWGGSGRAAAGAAAGRESKDGRQAAEEPSWDLEQESSGPENSAASSAVATPQRGRPARSSGAGAAPRGAEQHGQAQTLLHGGGASRARAGSRHRQRSGAQPARQQERPVDQREQRRAGRRASQQPVPDDEDNDPDDVPNPHKPEGRPLTEYQMGDEVVGRVEATRPSGVWFDVGAARLGKMPARLFSRNQPDFELGDIVEGIKVDSVDHLQHRLTLSGVGVVFTPPGAEFPERNVE